MYLEVIDEAQILFLHYLQFLADFCNQHDRVASAFKATRTPQGVPMASAIDQVRVYSRLVLTQQ